MLLRTQSWVSGCVTALAFAFTNAGCAHRPAEARRLPAWVFEASRTELGPQGRNAGRPPSAHPQGGIAGRSEASDFVVEALQDAGFRFGTDGSVASLWGYLGTSHVPITPSDARKGDVLFFRLSTTSGVPIGGDCDSPDHAGIVTGVYRDGRIAFVEARGGHVGKSYVDPLHPQLRRDMAGRVHNTFLRQKRADDPPGTPNFAGEMLCGAVRPRT